MSSIDFMLQQKIHTVLQNNNNNDNKKVMVSRPRTALRHLFNQIQGYGHLPIINISL